MASEAGYPVTLIHPNKKLPRIAQDDMPAVAGQFPDIVVHGVMDEAKYRSQGYLRFGEHSTIIDHHEYPKMMRHAEFVDEIPARTELRVEDGKILGTYIVPSVPAVKPDRIANNPKEEDALVALGYKPAGEYNKPALDAVLSSTIDNENYDPDEYPKWVNGELIYRDPNTPEEATEDGTYPRWENGVLISDPKQPFIDPNKYPMWIHVDGVPSEKSELANSPAQEHEIRMRLMPPKQLEPEPELELPSAPVASKKTASKISLPT